MNSYHMEGAPASSGSLKPSQRGSTPRPFAILPRFPRWKTLSVNPYARREYRGITHKDVRTMSYGIALDIGTSGFRCQAIDLDTGKTLSAAVTERHPIPGMNVIDHVNFAMKAGEDVANGLMIGAINNLFKELNIDPKKVGVMGSSAGGHLAAYVSTLAPDADKPNFPCLFYPVITSQEDVTHRDTFYNLVGRQSSDYDRAFFSLETRVTKTTPPAIIFHSDADQVVPPVSSSRYYNALKKHGIPAELHIYPNGWHGWVMHPEYEQYDKWQRSLLEWVHMQ